ncbi:hypothetical protein ACJMK2_029404 [Sinanodonta woodiana]|uniref:Uncharacterized protein n=1 Tax=Sinanodonta woodiana TaxID=1069815 RepID=A0ABD3XBX5_SINWO
MAQIGFLIYCMVILYIFSECRFTTVHVCGDPANVSSLKLYGNDKVCCNSSLYSKVDDQGRIRDCCDNKLFYRDMCTCNTNGQLESNDSGFPLDQCLATASNSSEQDIKEMSTASSKVPAGFINDECQTLHHKFCKYTLTCFYPSREVCCQDGVYNGRNVCPSLKTNSKFCTDNKSLDKRNICAKKYKYGYHISLGKTVAEYDRYRLFNATVKEVVMPNTTRRLPKKRFVKLKIDSFGLCNNYTLTRRKFTVFSAQKYKWNADPYFYLNKDDFVLRKNISKKRLTRIINNCTKSAQNYEMNTGIESVSKSGDKQFCCTHSFVTLEFIFVFLYQII